jgi:DNA-binding NarL/FixJ family response regulator/signal transduction histidine kinase
MAVAAMVVAIVNAAIRCQMRSYLLLSAYVIALAAIHAVLYLNHSAYLTELIAAVPAVAVGLVARARRERAEIDERKRVEDARASERRRIAREMHDVLAHRISMVSVHAGALEYHPDAPPEEVAKAAGVIRTSAHAALGELREVINLLRAPADQGNREADEGLQRPQPTLDDLPALIEESRQGGTSVRLDVHVNERAAIPAATGRTVYRVVQEGLTNARKHATGSEADVEIATDGDSTLIVSVQTHPGATAGTAEATTQTSPPGSGTGLIGLAERVALGGGRLDHGPTAEGGYALKATLATAHVSDRIRVLIVDDDALVRSGLRMMLSGSDRVDVVAEAQDGSEVLGAVDAHRPDVVLMDLRMPKVDGLAATELLRGQPRPPHVLVLTTFDADELVLRALRAGAEGFVLKDTPPAEILRAIELVAAGEGILSPTVTRQLIAHVAGDGRTAEGRRATARRRLDALTERELEVAHAVGQGKTNADIAAELYMSVATVKAHVTRVLSKLGVQNRVQIALLVSDAEP